MLHKPVIDFVHKGTSHLATLLSFGETMPGFKQGRWLWQAFGSSACPCLLLFMGGKRYFTEEHFPHKEHALLQLLTQVC